ncbi:MAG: hypothetical protein PSN04_10695 [Methyloprofundus sp.]|nr:hypothetical protein [Methyloprofundus sp.]
MSSQLFAADSVIAVRATSNLLMNEGSVQRSVELTQTQDISFVNFMPLVFLVVAGVFLFRSESVAAEENQQTAKPLAKEEPVEGKQEVTTKIEPKLEVSSLVEEDEIKDLSIGEERCQSTTAKKTRCKRKTTLERIEVAIENKKYRYLSCRQHSAKFTPYVEKT